MKLKTIVPKVFKKIGFHYRRFIFNYMWYSNIDTLLERSIKGVMPLESCEIQYPTILTSKEFIDCLVDYVWDKKLFDKINVNPPLKTKNKDTREKINIIVKTQIIETLKQWIIDWLYNNTIADYLYYLILK